MARETIVRGVLERVYAERFRQDEKWGEQNHVIVTPEAAKNNLEIANAYKMLCDHAAGHGLLTWKQILLEEVFEALSTLDPDEQITELVQVAAIACAMVECIERNRGKHS